jgi:hypothetical protein
MNAFVPELGHLAFGQPSKQFEAPQIMHAVLSFVSDRLDMLMWNLTQKEYHSPFFNYGGEFRNDVFHVEAYSWSDEPQPYNFAWKDVRISWYKHIGRGMSANVEITPDMAAACLADCVASLDAMETDD